MDRKIKLTPLEHDQNDHLADLYSILCVTESLEKAFIKSLLSTQEYTQECTNLISQYKTIIKMNNINTAEFVREYNMDCKYALKRLVEIGVPATVEHSVVVSGGDNSKAIAETVQYFITLMDALKLNVIAVDEIHPILSDLIQALNKSTSKSSGGKLKIKEWLVELNLKRASDELTEAQTRQLLFDLERFLLID
jgi:ESCRT-I complex subunit VPS28